MVKLIKDILNEDERHIQSLYKNWATKKSGNPTLANSLMGDFFKYQKSLPKKDFIQYKSADELKSVIDDVKKRFQDKQIEKEVDKIYEDNSLLVVMAKTWEASCKYGSGTKWCTAWDKDKSYFNRHKSNGTEFIWINKKIPADNPYHKLSLFIDFKGTHDWCSAINKCSPSNPYELGNITPPKNYQTIFDKCSEINNKNHEEKIQQFKELERSLEEKPFYTEFLNYLNSREFEDEYLYFSDNHIDNSLNDFYDEENDSKLESLEYCLSETIENEKENIKEELKNYFRNEVISGIYDIEPNQNLYDILDMFNFWEQLEEIISEKTQHCF